MNNTQLRKFAIRLLDDENGINEAAWIDLRDRLIERSFEDITNAVEAADGRYFLPEDHGLVA